MGIQPLDAFSSAGLYSAAIDAGIPISALDSEEKLRRFDPGLIKKGAIRQKLLTPSEREHQPIYDNILARYQ